MRHNLRDSRGRFVSKTTAFPKERTYDISVTVIDPKGKVQSKCTSSARSMSKVLSFMEDIKKILSFYERK